MFKHNRVTFSGCNEKLRVGITTSVIQRGKTGVAQYVFSLVRAFLKHTDEHDFTLFVLEEDAPLFEFAAEKMTIVIVSEKWRSAVKNIVWHHAVLPGLVEKLGLDVLHVPSYRRLLWRKSCALVSTIHDLAPFHVKGKYDPLRMFYGRVIVKHLARRQDAVISISTNTARDVEKFFGIPVDEQNIVLNGLDHARFHPGDQALARSFVQQNCSLNSPYFLYVSRLEHPAKNHVRLIEAFNHFKAATGSRWLLALGGSDWHGAEHIYAAAKSSPYANDIRFLGFVDDAALPNLYRAAGAFVYPSLFEGFGLPPVEAMACGCPVISSTRGSLDEVVGDAALRIDAEDTSAITAAMHQVSENVELKNDLIEKGLKNAKRFEWSENARAVLEVYKKH